MNTLTTFFLVALVFAVSAWASVAIIFRSDSDTFPQAQDVTRVHDALVGHDCEEVPDARLIALRLCTNDWVLKDTLASLTKVMT